MSDMAYSSKFVLSILVNGEPQRELGNGVVPLPWGVNYALRLRNKNNRRALAKVFIDGENVSGGGFLINAKDKIDLLRPVDKDAAFKFVSIDSIDAQDFGKSDNHDKKKGVVEVRFHLEKEQYKYSYTSYPSSYPSSYPYPTYQWQYSQPFTTSWYNGFCGPHTYYSGGGKGSSCGNLNYTEISKGGTVNDGGTLLSSDSSFATKTCSVGPITSASNTAASYYNCSTEALRGCDQFAGVAAPRERRLSEGCTVEGVATGQKFNQIYFAEEEDYVTLRVVLQGYAGAVPVPPPVVESLGFCTNCGSQRIVGANFCGHCGQKF